MSVKMGFRCKTCGHLHNSACAGIRTTPTACIVCGAGVTFTPSGTKTYQSDNWEILADATPERLTELGLTAADVDRHTPRTSQEDLSADLERIEANHATLTAKEADWIANADKYIAQWQDLDRQLELAEKALTDNADYTAIGRLTDAIHKLKQAKRHIEAKEFTPRDKGHKSHLESRRAEHQSKGATKTFTRQPQTIAAHATEGVSGAGTTFTK